MIGLPPTGRTSFEQESGCSRVPCPPAGITPTISTRHVGIGVRERDAPARPAVVWGSTRAIRRQATTAVPVRVRPDTGLFGSTSPLVSFSSRWQQQDFAWRSTGMSRDFDSIMRRV